MPQIPVYVGGQRVEAGSPVPINSAENTGAGMMASAVEKFGASMFKFGDVLDDVMSKNAQARDGYKVKQATAEYRLQLSGLQNDVASMSVAGDDPSGRSVGMSFLEEAQKIKDKFFKGLDNDQQRMMFGAESAEEDARFVPQVMAKAADVHEKVTTLERSKFISSTAKLARDNPSALPIYELEVEEKLESDLSILPANKPLVISAAKKELSREAVRGLSQQNKFELARATVNSASMSKKFSTTELDAIRDEIVQDENKFYDLNWKRDQRTDALLKKKTEADMRNADSQYTELLRGAGNDQVKINVIHDMIRDDPRFIGYPEHQKRLMGVSIEQEKGDDNSTDLFWDQVAKGKKLEELDTFLDNTYKAGKLSKDRKMQLEKSLAGMKDARQRDPNLQAIIGAMELEIKAQGTLKGIQNGTAVEIQDQNTAEAVTVFRSAVAGLAENKTLSPLTAATARDRILRNKLGQITKGVNIPGIPLSAVATEETAVKAIAGLKKDIMTELSKKQNGLPWDSKKVEAIQKQLGPLKIQLQNLQNEKRYKPAQIKSAPAKGRNIEVNDE